jgi:hypothetical protein
MKFLVDCFVMTPILVRFLSSGAKQNQMTLAPTIQQVALRGQKNK